MAKSKSDSEEALNKSQLLKAIHDIEHGRGDPALIQALNSALQTPTSESHQPFMKLPDCQLSGCMEIHYFKGIFQELRGTVPVLNAGEICEIPIHHVHSIGFNFNVELPRLPHVRLTDGTAYLLHKMSLKEVKAKFRHILFDTSRDQLFNWFSFANLRKEGKHLYITMHGLGNEEVKLTKERSDRLETEQAYFMKFMEGT